MAKTQRSGQQPNAQSQTLISAPDVAGDKSKKRAKSGERELKKAKTTKVATKSRKDGARNSTSQLQELEVAALAKAHSAIEKKENLQSNSSKLIGASKEAKKIRDLTLSSNSS